MKPYALDTHLTSLNETIEMSTKNIGFRAE